MMRSILVHGDRGPAMGHRVQTSLDLARAMNGHITVLIDTPIVRYLAIDQMGGYVASEAMEQALADDDAAAATLEAGLKAQGVPFEVKRSEAGVVEALASAARLADLVVMSRASGLAGDVAIASRTPVLMLRDDQPLVLPLENACVAWDGGNESAMALRAAVPLLRQCRAVQVLTVTEKPGGAPAADALAYLMHHDVTADPKELVRRGSTEETLAEAVQQAEAQLLVMGAYGRSRMRELLFGGVTRFFLESDSAPPLLLAH